MNNVYLSCCILPEETQETKALSFIKNLKKKKKFEFKSAINLPTKLAMTKIWMEL